MSDERSASPKPSSTMISNDHEPSKNAAKSTLPNAFEHHSNLIQERSVMWAAPASAGSRSESPSRPLPHAAGVPDNEPAGAGSGAGAADASGDGRTRRTQAAAAARQMMDGHNEDAVGSAHGASAVDEQLATLHAAYERVRVARALIIDMDAERAAAKRSPPSANSISQYTARLAWLDAISGKEHGSGDASLLVAAIANYASSAGTFYNYRAAAIWRESEAVRDLLKIQAKQQRDPAAAQDWARTVERLHAAASRLSTLRSLSRAAALGMTGHKRRRASSKKEVLKVVDDDWRNRFLALTSSNETYKVACLLTMLCGLRPEEMQRGVLVKRHGPNLAIKVEGAKVGEHSGQPWRGFMGPVSLVPSWFVDELGDDLKTFSANKDNMRSYLYRLSPAVFPPKAGKKQQRLSAYVHRHAVATDLRQDSWLAEEIAQVLGQASADTTRHYGFNSRGSKGRRSRTSIGRGTVATARTVRSKDRTFISKKNVGAKPSAAKPRR